MKTNNHTRIAGLIALIIALLSLTSNAQSSQQQPVTSFENVNICACSQQSEFCQSYIHQKEVSATMPQVCFADLKFLGINLSFNEVVRYNADVPRALLSEKLKIWFRDSDSDGLGDPLNVRLDVNRPEGYTNNTLDSNDSVPFVSTDSAKNLLIVIHQSKL